MSIENSFHQEISALLEKYARGNVVLLRLEAKWRRISEIGTRTVYQLEAVNLETESSNE